ncbi:MAG: DUF4097 domain-containing protein [Clostridiales Family XIII bacterium]|jgi:hypothetical protein|nr:DUF4097 domain-containing protein [Clostridiales Family XIII bacterium]
MSKTVKILLITAAVMICCGAVIAGIGFLQGGMNSVIFGHEGLYVIDSRELGNMDEVDSAYPGVKNITIDADMVPVVRVVRGDELRVKAQNPKAFGGVSAKTEGDELIITSEKRRLSNWFGVGPFGFNIGNVFQNKGYIEVTVPEGVTLDRVKITANFPKVAVSDVNAADLDVNCDMGGITIEGVHADRLHANADMGSVKVRSSKAGALIITADMGALEVRDVSADSAKVKVDAGGASLVGFESGGLDLSCNMGGVKLVGVLKGTSEIDCDMGGVELNLKQPRDSLSWDIETEVGAATVNGTKVHGAYTAPNPVGTLEISADMGGVAVNFTD